MSEQFERFTMHAEYGYDVRAHTEPDGEWVKAQDALDREARLQTQIDRLNLLWEEAEKRARLLQKQLRSLERDRAMLEPLLEDKARLDSGCIITRDRDDFGDGYINCERRGLDLRADIDAAMAARNRT
jgi:hypothetical protein